MSVQIFINGERLHLRPVEPKDAATVAACNNHPEIRHTFFTHTPISEELQAEQIKTYYSKGSDYLPLMICLNENQKPIGVTAFHRIDLISGAAVFSICISDHTEWGKGYGKEATKMMLEYAFNILNLHRIQLHVWTENKAAVKTYKACGFKLEGTLREAMKHNNEYCDFHVMGILEHEWRESFGG